MRRRTIADTLCTKGRVRINGTVAKASAAVRAGDVLTIAFGDRRVVAKILNVPDRAAPSTEYVEVLARLDIDDLARA